jgi:hypothetical protein
MAIIEINWKQHGPNQPQEAELARLDDYEAGDPSLDLVKRADGLFDLVIYRGATDLTVPAQTARQVRAVAHKILALIPEI